MGVCSDEKNVPIHCIGRHGKYTRVLVTTREPSKLKREDADVASPAFSPEWKAWSSDEGYSLDSLTGFREIVICIPDKNTIDLTFTHDLTMRKFGCCTVKCSISR